MIFNKKTCLICSKKCGKIYTTVKYRYENEQIGEVYVCEACSKEYDVENANVRPDDGEPL